MSARVPNRDSETLGGTSGSLAAGTVLRAIPLGGTEDATAIDAAVTELYSAHYRFLVRIAVLLGHDGAAAEDIVQDSFAATCACTHPVWGAGQALPYLLAAVVSRSRWHLRRSIADQNARKRAPEMPINVHGVVAPLERSEVMAGLRRLPVRQREAVVLRYYGNLSLEQAATAMGITIGAVNRLTSRAMAALRSALERAS